MKKAAASAIDTGTRAVYEGRRQQADGGAREPHPQGQSAAPLQVAGAPQQAGRHDPADGAPNTPPTAVRLANRASYGAGSLR